MQNGTRALPSALSVDHNARVLAWGMLRYSFWLTIRETHTVVSTDEHTLGKGAGEDNDTHSSGSYRCSLEPPHPSYSRAV